MLKAREELLIEARSTTEMPGKTPSPTTCPAGGALGKNIASLYNRNAASAPRRVSSVKNVENFPFPVFWNCLSVFDGFHKKIHHTYLVGNAQPKSLKAITIVSFMALSCRAASLRQDLTFVTLVAHVKQPTCEPSPPHKNPPPQKYKMKRRK